MENNPFMSDIQEDDMPIMGVVVFKIHKNKYFKFDPLRYVNGAVSSVFAFTCDRDIFPTFLEWICSEIIEYKWALFYCLPNKSLEQGLKLIHTDNDVHSFFTDAERSGGFKEKRKGEQKTVDDEHVGRKSVQTSRKGKEIVYEFPGPSPTMESQVSVTNYKRAIINGKSKMVEVKDVGLVQPVRINNKGSEINCEDAFDEKVKSKLKSHEKGKLDACSMSPHKLVEWEQQEAGSPNQRTPPLKPKRKGLAVDNDGGSSKHCDLVHENVVYNGHSLPNMDKERFSNNSTCSRPDIDNVEVIGYVIGIHKAYGKMIAKKSTYSSPDMDNGEVAVAGINKADGNNDYTYSQREPSTLDVLVQGFDSQKNHPGIDVLQHDTHVDCSVAKLNDHPTADIGVKVVPVDKSADDFMDVLNDEERIPNYSLDDMKLQDEEEKLISTLAHHLDLWIDLMWYFREPDTDWAMISPYFLTCTLGGSMIDYYASGLRYPVAWRYVEKETMVAKNEKNIATAAYFVFKRAWDFTDQGHSSFNKHDLLIVEAATGHIMGHTVQVYIGNSQSFENVAIQGNAGLFFVGFWSEGVMSYVDLVKVFRHGL
nr:phospholipase-like protein [Tanacetum cinerariifolium]